MQFTLSLPVHLPLCYRTHHLPISDCLGNLFCTHPHPREREGWGIGLYGSGNNGSASIQWSWSLRDARDRLGHKLRAGILYYLLEGHTAHTQTRGQIKRLHIVFFLSLPVALSDPGSYHCSTSTLSAVEQAHPPAVRIFRGPDQDS